MKIGPGATLAHYEIVSLLGKGGMGEVWRARDTKLKREVALKVLPPEMAADPSRLHRFQTEAEAVARLNHPHIVTIFTIEEEDGIRFLTMECVEGVSLDKRLTPDGLPLEMVFHIGIAVADALAAAHEKQIVHRDLKPTNIVVGDGGVVKVLDFSLAKLAAGVPDDVADPDSDTKVKPVTNEGAVMGTAPYMSPEQARGKEIDHRSDVFSLGVVLYEMVSGQRPFQGETMSDVTSSLLRDTPTPISQLRPEVPRHLGRLIAHCLEKEVERRAQSARDIRNELESLRDEVRLTQSGSAAGESSWRTGPESRATPGDRSGLWIAIAAVAVVAAVVAFVMGRGTSETVQPAAAMLAGVVEGPEVDPNSIVVLPFVNMSDDASNEYFSDGISEELLNLLARIPELRVTSRSSAFSFKGKDVPIPEIARRLRVAHVLEGSVRKAGGRVRITAQLVEAESDTRVWSETYDRELDDIFAIQDEIAADVVTRLRGSLLGATPTTRKTNPDAYALYLQAVHLGRQITPAAFEQSDTLYRNVLEIDPGYPPAWEGLANNALNQAQSGLLSGEEGYARARDAIDKALAIDPAYGPAYARLGWIAMTGNDLAGAARHFERALALDPRDIRVLASSAMLLGVLGRLDEGLAIQEAVVRRDPVNVTRHFNLGLSQIHAGRLDDAIGSFRTVLSLSPGRGNAHYGIGVALLLKGDAKGALTEFEQETSEPWRMLGLPMADHALGRRADSDAALDALVAKYEKDFAYNIAYVFAFRGDSDRAFEWLDKAIDYGDPGVSEIVVENLFANVHDDPRWLPLLLKLGKAPEQLAEIEFIVTLPEQR
jgi:TolB-like protein